MFDLRATKSVKHRGQQLYSMLLRGLDWNSMFPNHEDQAVRRIHKSANYYMTRHDLVRNMAHNDKETKESGDRELDEGKIRLQQVRRKRGFHEVSPEDTDYVKVISGARERSREMRGSSNVLNFLGGSAWKFATMPISQRAGKLEATMLSKSSERETKPHQ